MAALKVVAAGVQAGDFMCGLFGPRGTGKTQLAVIAARMHFSRCNPMYCKVVEYFQSVKSTFGTRACEEDVIAEYCRAGLLIIDEVQERLSSEWENVMFTHLIDKRYDSMKSTILIGNISDKDDEITRHLGSSIVSRLTETGGVISTASWPRVR
jgi:DNA replication protein DnaC